MTARTRVDMTAPRISEKRSFMGLNEFESSDNDIDQFDGNELNNDSAHAIDKQVALQRREGANGRIFHAAQRQRDQRDDDERVENDGAEDRALRRNELHDVE